MIEERDPSPRIDDVPSFCIALPVYNKSAVIERCIKDIAAFLENVG